MRARFATVAIRIVALALFTPGCIFAETWSGYLVDARCFANGQRIVNPNDSQSSVDLDRGYQIRHCAPNAKTKSFGIVESDGTLLRLDTRGNTKAAELQHNVKKKSTMTVEVTGRMLKNTIEVLSISPSK